MVEVLVKAAPIQAVSLNGVRPYVYQVFRYDTIRYDNRDRFI